MTGIEIRVAEKKDADLIAGLSRKTFYETFAAVNSQEDMDKFMNEQFTHEALIKEVEEGKDVFLLAFEDDTAVGYARMREGGKQKEFENKPSIEIARIYAVNAAIGTGVGSALMQKCLAIAAEMKRQVIWLGVWEKNQRAIGFYQKWGFKKFGEHDFLLGNDLQTDWLMKKHIE